MGEGECGERGLSGHTGQVLRGPVGMKIGSSCRGEPEQRNNMIQVIKDTPAWQPAEKGLQVASGGHGEHIGLWASSLYLYIPIRVCTHTCLYKLFIKL